MHPTAPQEQIKIETPVRDQLKRRIHDLRISVIDRCNFRCRYCMPEEEYSKHYTFLKPESWLTYAEIFRLTKIFVSQGVEKVRLTGGEPLLRPGLSGLIRDLSTIEGIDDLALTTNGLLLEQYTDELKRAGLKRLTVSLDTLDPQIFRHMSGGKGDVEQVLRGIAAAERAGFKNIKINTVVQKGVNDHTILDLIEHFRGSGHIIRFIEYMDVGNCNHWDLSNVVSSASLLKTIQAHFPLDPLSANYNGEVAARYRFRDGAGEIGFISSVTQPFCGSCTRARLSTDGKIYTCLFASSGSDIRLRLRSGAGDAELRDFIQTLWSKREDRYSEQRNSFNASHKASQRIEMFQIGG